MSGGDDGISKHKGSCNFEGVTYVHVILYKTILELLSWYFLLKICSAISFICLVFHRVPSSNLHVGGALTLSCTASSTEAADSART